MPEDPDIPHRPVSRPPTRPGEFIEEQDEQDLWDLDDMPTPSREAAPPTEPAPESVDPSPAADPAELSDVPDLSDVPATPAPAPELAPESAPAPSPAADRGAPPEIDPADPTDAPAPGKPLERRDRTVIVAACGALALIAATGLFLLFSGLEAEPEGVQRPDFPVQGEHVSVAETRSYWRKPVFSGEDRDVARPEVEFLPAVEVTLEGGSGALRAIFRDANDTFIGDPITRSVSGGTFDRSGAATLEFAATDGFHGDGQYHSYRVGDDRWHIEILEASSVNASGDEFRTLFRMPLSSSRR